ncbi:MAG: NifU family protein, partial [Deltaproteobacteria bacterium]|nr:NifU family protein [Deltaproteobacteria bacterium]
MKEKIEEALNSIRPALQADGGDVELVDFDEE